jgi:flavin reductase (DIM6/NTAB) family NADH-FMN oxidoreductase RutF
MNTQGFRQTLGAFATGVCVVTAPNAKGADGITVNSFTSVSLAPPLVLWCLGDRSERFEQFSTAEEWGVSILAAEQADLASRFAGAGAQELAAREIERLGEGGPVLARALARLACRTTDRIRLGDHVVIVGEVCAFDSRPGDALTYFRSRFGIAPEPEKAALTRETPQ